MKKEKANIIQDMDIKKIIRYYKSIWALTCATALCYWDTETYMPKGEATERGLYLAEISNLKQKLFLKNNFKNLIKKCAHKRNLNEYETGVVRVLTRDLRFYEKIPSQILKEFEKVKIEARVAWQNAKEKSDFSIFEPHLKKIVDLSKIIAEKLGYTKTPYNALLDLYEEELTVRDTDNLFKDFIPELKKIFDRVVKEKNFPHSHPLEKEKYDTQAMIKLNQNLLNSFGFSFERGRIDVSAHPFTSGIGINDVRITTWYRGINFKESYLATVHEFGHALYEQQLNPEFMGSPLGSSYLSLGFHESQSRFWENHIAKSKAFCEAYFQVFMKYLPFLKKYNANEFYKYVNVVRPSFIRVESDEISYHFHIFLRYQLERMLVEDKLEVSEIPQEWNQKFEKYIGLTPPTDREGCLQDIHWSTGAIGYFPTYSLGSIIASQIASKMSKDIGLLDEKIVNSNYEAIRNWLKDNIHIYGSVYAPKVLIRKSLNQQFNSQVLLKYLKNKYLNVR